MVGEQDRGAQQGHVVVFGFQGVGRRIVRQLTTTGRRVVVVDPYADAAQQVDLQRWGATYLAGYGDSQDTLGAANVAAAHAVLCVTDDDVRNIRLALLVRDRSPDVRLVVRMANPSVASALLPVADPGAVLDVAQLAAPSFVEAVSTDARTRWSSPVRSSWSRPRRAPPMRRSPRCGGGSRRSRSARRTAAPPWSARTRGTAWRPVIGDADRHPR